MATPSLPRSAAADTDPPRARVRLVRSVDQLDLLIELFDAMLVDGQVTIDGENPRLRLLFGSQHLVEEGFLVTDAIPADPVDHLSAGPSAIVVPITSDFDLTVAAILGLTRAVGALSPDTALEVPRGLLLAPASPARMSASPDPSTFGTTTEVWTARIERGDDNGPPELRATANVAAIDVANAVPCATTRDSLVDNTALAPLTSPRLWLSSSGAFTDLHGEWPSDLACYDHRMATGRDLRVEVGSLGYLLPFGQRAAITETTQRTLVDDEEGGQTAVLQVSRHLRIVDATVTTPRVGEPHEGRGLPLTAITATASETAQIDLVPVDLDGDPIDGVFDVTAGGADVMVSYASTDRGGNPVSFELPATFIDDSTAHATGAADAPARLIEVANAPARRARRELDLRGQPVAYADPAGAGATSKATHEFLLVWQRPEAGTGSDDLADARTPAAYAAVKHADVVDDVIGAVTGDVGDLIRVTLHDRWLEHGNNSGPTENFDLAYLTLKQPTHSLVGGDSPVRGVAQLDVVAEVFNQLTGVGPNRALPTSEWDIGQIVGEASKIIGNISLGEVIVSVLEPVLGVDLPGTTVTIAGNTAVARFTYCPRLTSRPAVGFMAHPDTRCCVHLTTTASLDDGIEASFSTEMRVENFDLHFPPGLSVPLAIAMFDSVVATVHSDGSTSVTPTISGWDFSGTISVLMALVDELGMGNIDLKVLSDVIDVDSTVTLPDISLGVAELKNFAINLGMDIPLREQPGELSVGIASKSAPLDIDVLMFGATFWFGIDLGFTGKAEPPQPVQTISMGLSVYWEMFDFDIVVVRASFTLRLSADWRLSEAEVVVTGAVSLEGEIAILGGLLDASVSIVCSLTYRSVDETLRLKGTVYYAVGSFLGDLDSGSVPLGETTIELGDGSAGIGAGVAARRAERAPAAGPGGSASFGDRYTPAEWHDYCDAFA